MDCPKCGFHIEGRTTGKYSQNHGIHGFASQIAKYMNAEAKPGYQSLTQHDVIQEAARRASIPSAPNRFGSVSYLHESSWTKQEASTVITALRDIAEFLGCRLVEVNDK